MRIFKLILVIIVYFAYLPYIVVMLSAELVKNVVLESINYFKNTNI